MRFALSQVCVSECACVCVCRVFTRFYLYVVSVHHKKKNLSLYKWCGVYIYGSVYVSRFCVYINVWLCVYKVCVGVCVCLSEITCLYCTACALHDSLVYPGRFVCICASCVCYEVSVCVQSCVCVSTCVFMEPILSQIKSSAFQTPGLCALNIMSGLRRSHISCRHVL